MKLTIFVIACLAFAVTVFADTYMHNPRGSNNRLNERSANRNNGNRMFDSQNNNRGGYNKGDLTDDAAGNDDLKQYDFTYYMSAQNHETQGGKSFLTVEWTNQHGCGGNEHGDPHKLNCNILLQYMCVPEAKEYGAEKTRDYCNKQCYKPIAANPTCVYNEVDRKKDPNGPPACPSLNFVYNVGQCTSFGGIWQDAIGDDVHNCPHECSAPADAGSDEDCTGTWTSHTDGEERPKGLRDGVTTNRQSFTNANAAQFNAAQPEAERLGRKEGDIDYDEGLHESWEWYDECQRRERNRGLFTADQNLRNNNLGYSSAVYTRQNPNNNRRGYECPEERDYWPYWHPSPWVDIVVMTDRLDLCAFYQSESQNVKSKHHCRNTANCPNCIRFNNEEKCLASQGRWVEVGKHDVAAPECIQAPWSRVNHNGNGRTGQHNSYNWTLPHITYGNQVAVAHRCVLRLRYNISTDDYDAWRVNASFNNNNGQGIVSPVRQNPNVDIGADNQALRLAINTAQFGRTFQDRSHVFKLVPRMAEANLPANRPRAPGTPNDFFGRRNLYNLNVRGKRGNIVQTYPSVEYDFVPNQLTVSDQDLVHIQWTGSNTHNNGNPAGDGQAGDAGEGRGGTDRHNFVELTSKQRDFGESFPATWEENTIFTNMVDALDAEDANTDTKSDIAAADGWKATQARWALRMATVGYYKSFDQIGKTDDELNNLLNNAPASYRGAVFRFGKGTYNYMCTRNHNFSNRDQKGVLVVE